MIWIDFELKMLDEGFFCSLKFVVYYFSSKRIHSAMSDRYDQARLLKFESMKI